MLREYFEAKRALLADNPDVDFAIRRALIEDIHECIAVCGDSAGGGLAVMASVWLCDSARELPAAVCAFSPWVDLECRGDSLRTNAHLDAFIAQELAEQLTALYLGPAGSPTDPKANVLHANLGGLRPPSCLWVDTRHCSRTRSGSQAASRTRVSRSPSMCGPSNSTSTPSWLGAPWRPMR